MLRKIYRELVAIRKALQADAGETVSLKTLNMTRKPYERALTEHRRFELLTDNEAEKECLERILAEKNLSRQDLAIILFGLRVLPGFGKKDFGI